jgi:hypothetical protein
MKPINKIFYVIVEREEKNMREMSGTKKAYFHGKIEDG